MWPRRPERIRKRNKELRLIMETLEDRLTPATFNAVDVPNLIADIILANANGTANTINLTAPDGFYDLNAADNSNGTAGGNGLPVITSPFLLTINGNGATIERNSGFHFRLFDVDTRAQLSLNNVTLAFGLVNGFEAEGGAISNGGTLTLSHDVIRDNEALGASGSGTDGEGGGADGGGIYNAAGASLTMTACTLSGNMAQGGNGAVDTATKIPFGEPGGFAAGGGIENDGSMIISACLLDGNVATGGNGGGNGANGGDGAEAVGGGVINGAP